MLIAARGVVAFMLLAFWLWAIFDVIRTDDSAIQNLPKLVWLMIVIILSDIGALAWLLLGRPQGVGWRPGDTRTRPSTTTYRGGYTRDLPPDEDPNFLSSLDESAFEAKRQEAIRRYEEEKRRREEERRRLEEGLLRDGDDPPDPPSDAT